MRLFGQLQQGFSSVSRAAAIKPDVSLFPARSRIKRQPAALSSLTLEIPPWPRRHLSNQYFLRIVLQSGASDTPHFPWVFPQVLFDPRIFVADGLFQPLLQRARHLPDHGVGMQPVQPRVHSHLFARHPRVLTLKVCCVIRYCGATAGRFLSRYWSARRHRCTEERGLSGEKS